MGRFPNLRIIDMSSNIHIKDHMKSLGLSPNNKMDKFLYATMLQTNCVSVPRALRGSRKDPVSGFKWKRKDEFVIKQRYSVPMTDLIDILVEACNKMNVSLNGTLLLGVDAIDGGIFHIHLSKKYIKLTKYPVLSC